MRAVLLAVALVASTPAWSTTVYKWVDQAGVVHFSDTPFPGAQKIEVGAAQTYAAPGAAVNAAPRPREAARPPAALSCAVDSPTNDQVFTDTNQVSGHVTIAPDPGPEDTVVVALDGSTLEGGAAGFTVPVARGTHTVSVTVTAPDGQVRCQSSATFHVRQQSIVRAAAPLVPTAPSAPAAPAAPGVGNQTRPAR